MATSAQSMSHYISSTQPVSIIPQPPTSHRNHPHASYQHSRTHQTHRSPPEIYCRFHAGTQGRILRHSDAECRHPSNPRNIQVAPGQRQTSQHRSPHSHPKARQTYILPHPSHPEKPTPYHHEHIIYDATDLSAPSRNLHIVLDSAAFPTHHPHPLPSTHRLQGPSETTTATGAPSSVTHAGTIQVNTNTNHRLLTNIVVAPHIPDTLLTVRSITGRHRPMVFTKDHAYILHHTDITPDLRTRVPFATCKQSGYTVHGNITSPSPHKHLANMTLADPESPQTRTTTADSTDTSYNTTRPNVHRNHTATHDDISSNARISGTTNILPSPQPATPPLPQASHP